MAPTASLDAEALAQLTALGYIGDVGAEAGEVDPRDVIDVIPLTWMARQAISQGDLRTASQALAELQRQMPDTYGVALLEAQLLRTRGDSFAAIEAYTDLYLRSPSSTVALQLADLHGGLGAWVDTQGWYEEALSLQPASPEAMAGQVRALLAQGETLEAAERAARFLEVYPDHAELWLMHAQIMLTEGRVHEARTQAQWALRRMPLSPWAFEVVAQASWESGDADLAIERLQDAMRLDPYDLPRRVTLTTWLLEVGRSAEAVRAARPVARLFPEDEALAALLAEAEAALAAERGGR